MLSTPDVTFPELDKSKTWLFTLLTVGYLSVYVYLGSLDSGDPEFILSVNPLILLGTQALMTGVYFFLLPFLIWRYGLMQTTNAAFQKIDWLSVGYVFFIAISAMFIISVMGAWNMAIDLPDSAFEDWAKSKEAEIKILTEYMIDFTGFDHFFASLIVIALIPAVGEELVFRGIFQNLVFKLSRNPHVGIWVSAILFSAIHLQFYGFFPRVFLGALFGYLYFWSGRLSIAMLAHFFNNAIALTMVYIAGSGLVEIEPHELEQAAPWSMVVVFLVLGIFILKKFKNHFENERLAKSV